jgi:hypothetical protein
MDKDKLMANMDHHLGSTKQIKIVEGALFGLDELW